MNKIYIAGSSYTSDPYEPSDNTIYGIGSSKEKALELLKEAILKSFLLRIKKIEGMKIKYDEYCFKQNCTPPDHLPEKHQFTSDIENCPGLSCSIQAMEKVNQQKKIFSEIRDKIENLQSLVNENNCYYGYLLGDIFYIHEIEIDILPEKYLNGHSY